MRYFIFFGYDGTNYHGWQIQPNANSVQQELQRALSILLRKEIEVVGAGRTDTGVHARNMAAHFDWNPEEKVSEEKISEEKVSEARIPMALDQLVYRLNRILPGGAAFPASRRLCGFLQGGRRQQDHHLPRFRSPMGTDLAYHLVFRDYRQPLSP